MNCEHIGDPIRIDGLCIDCWKARAEKAESALKNALEVSAKYEDRWYAEKQLREKAEAAAAEMRLIIMSFHNDIESGEISPAEPFVALLEHALSSDVGKGWLPPEEAERLRRINRDNDAVVNRLTAKLAIAVDCLELISGQSCMAEHPDGCVCCLSEVPVIDMADEALSKLKEEKA